MKSQKSTIELQAYEHRTLESKCTCNHNHVLSSLPMTTWISLNVRHDLFVVHCRYMVGWSRQISLVEWLPAIESKIQSSER